MWKSAAQTGPLLRAWRWGGAEPSSGAERKQRRGQQWSRRVWSVSTIGTGRYEEEATVSAWSLAVLGLIWSGPAHKGGVDRMIGWEAPRWRHCRASILEGDCLVPCPGASGLYYLLSICETWAKSLLFPESQFPPLWNGAIKNK